jgi:hypothetical protein
MKSVVPAGFLSLSLFITALIALSGVSTKAQESKLAADFRGERERFSANCTDFKKFIDCAQVLFTDHPLRIAVGSIALQNGFGAGPAFVAHWTPNESWRLSWDSHTPRRRRK